MSNLFSKLFASKMFDFLFGWRKASKCKKLIMRVQCRLKLLKNKRSCIVKQLRQDVAELLKNGHHQTSFEWVEKVLLEETMVQIYDLLYQCCEFIVIKLPYIRKHRDCPNDINEAVSTLIFSSSRFGNLPELLSIRNLFRQRYGRKFVSTALQLLPGNLVKHQIVENLDMKKVPDVVKYRLLDEIGRSCIQTEPKLEFCKHQINDSKMMLNEDEKSWKDLEEEVIYVDDIEELMIKDGNLQDQRLFLFKPFGVDLNSKPHHGIDVDREETESWSSRKLWRKTSRKSLHQESLNAAYYSESDETSSPEIRRKSGHHNQRNDDKREVGGNKKCNFADNIDRSNSFSFTRSYSPCPNIHPKLPDYDELAAKFMDLKRQNLQNLKP